MIENLKCSGYAAPEYVIEGFISTKSDVYSFGIIVLEIITGLQNSKFQTEEEADCLISYVSMNVTLTGHFIFYF